MGGHAWCPGVGSRILAAGTLEQWAAISPAQHDYFSYLRRYIRNPDLAGPDYADSYSSARIRSRYLAVEGTGGGSQAYVPECFEPAERNASYVGRKGHRSARQTSIHLREPASCPSA